MEKRTVAIMLLLFAAILALAVMPAVLAESNSDKGKIGDRVAAAAITKARTEDRMMPMMVRMIKADENFKVRPLTQDMIQRMRDRFEELKENDTRITEDYKGKLSRFNEILPQLRRCNLNATNLTANETRECPKIRTESIERSKQAALKAVDRILNHLEKLKEKLKSSENLPEDELTDRVAKIDALIAEVQEIQQEIEAADTKREINAALKDLKKLLAKVKHGSEHHSQGLLRSEIWGVLQRLEVTQKKLDCALAGFKANSTNTTALDEKLAQLNATMTQAKNKLNTAKGLLGSGNETQVAEGKALVREARGLVQQAHTMLQDIRKMIHDLGGRPCQEKQEIEIEEPVPPVTNITIPPSNLTNATNSTNNGTT